MDNKEVQSTYSNSSSILEPSPRDLVNDLEITWNTKIKGNLRMILENIAEWNLKKKYPIMKDIFIKGISLETKKKIFTRAKARKLIVIHPSKLGHSNRYALSNIQDFEIKGYSNNKLKKKVKPKDEIMNVNEILIESSFYMDAVSEMLGRTTIGFHRIAIKTELNFKEDYEDFNWKIPSIKNKAKVRDFRLVRNRGFNLTLYPNGTMILNIFASKNPFNLFSYEGLSDFNITCGQILEAIARVLKIDDLLSPEPLEWKVIQIEGAYDIPFKDLERIIAEKKSRKKGGWISFGFPPGSLKVRHLNNLYQIYTKRLPYKGRCLRLEDRLSFKESNPSLGDIQYNYLLKKESASTNGVNSSEQVDITD